MTKITDLAAASTLAAGDLLPLVDVSDQSMAGTGTTKKVTMAGVASACQGLKFLTGGGALTLAMITDAQAAGYQGVFLDPGFVWDASGLVLNGVSDFRVVSRMQGSIGWLGGATYNSGYISTGSGQDGIQVYASSPSTSRTQGVIFDGCVIVGANTRAVLHLGGGQRRCGLVNSLVYNTSTSAGAYAVVTGSGLSDNNTEHPVMSFTGGGGIAGAYGALGIGVADQTQRANDAWYYDLATSGGTYSIVKAAGGNHNFLGWYDRSAPVTATVWNHGGGRMTFAGGESQNGTGLAHLIDASTAQTVLQNHMVTQFSTPTTTCQVSAGALVMRGSCVWNSAQTIALSGTGILDLADPAINAGSLTVSGSAGTLVLPAAFAGTGSAPVLTSWTGTTVRPGPAVVATGRGTGATTTQTVTWTPPAVTGTRFRVSVMIRPTVAGTSTVPTVAWTEIGGQARSFTLAMWRGDGSATAPSYTCAAADSFYGVVESDTDGTATAVTVTITPTGSTFRWSVAIEQLT